MRLLIAAALVFYFSNLDWNVQPNIFHEERQVSVPPEKPAIAGVAADERADELGPTSIESPILISADTIRDPVAAQDIAPKGAIPEVSMEEVCSKLAAAAQEAEIPVSFLARLIWQESRFRSREISPVGAQGMAQFMPGTAAEEGLDDPFDPLKAIPAAAGFLRKLHRQFGNLGLAAAAYNAGSGRIRQWLARRVALPQETRDYVRRVTGNTAEDWTAPSHTVAMTLQLPKEAPCEGVGGLSRAKSAALIPVSLSAEAGDIVRKAEAEARAAAAAEAAAKARAKLLMARAQMGRRNGKAVRSLIARSDAKPGNGALKTATLPRAKPGKSAKVRLASAH
jgi:soluble lytic murein transglycosylase-like protein